MNKDQSLFTSTGVLDYSGSASGGYRLVVLIDHQLAAYYRSLIPKTVRLNGTRYAPHVTVVRNEYPPNLKKWGAYNGQKIEFQYSPYIYNNNTYYWLRVYCQKLTAIRLELGLPASYYLTRPPDEAECFHTTLGNCKNI